MTLDAHFDKFDDEEEEEEEEEEGGGLDDATLDELGDEDELDTGEETPATDPLTAMDADAFDSGDGSSDDDDDEDDPDDVENDLYDDEDDR